MYRALVVFPKSAGATDVDALIDSIATSFRGSARSQSITRSVGALMGPGAETGAAGWILEADFPTLEDAMTALDADDFHDVKVMTETLTSTIFLFEIEDRLGISLPDPDPEMDTLAQLAALVDEVRASQPPQQQAA